MDGTLGGLFMGFFTMDPMMDPMATWPYGQAMPDVAFENQKWEEQQDRDRKAREMREMQVRWGKAMERAMEEWRLFVRSQDFWKTGIW